MFFGLIKIPINTIFGIDDLAFAGIAAGLGSVAGAGINAAAQGSANQTNVNLNKENMAFQEHMADVQRGFQERMSNSAYQRQVQDMKSAGINPIVGFGGGGASSPSGSMPSSSPPTVEAVRTGDMLERGTASALASLERKKQFEQQDSQIALNAAAKAAKDTEVDVNKASAKQVEAQTEGVDQRNEVFAAQMDALKKQGSVAKKQADWDDKSIDYDNYVDKAAKGTSVIGNLIGNTAKGIRNLFGGSNPPPPRGRYPGSPDPRYKDFADWDRQNPVRPR